MGLKDGRGKITGNIVRRWIAVKKIDDRKCRGRTVLPEQLR